MAVSIVKTNLKNIEESVSQALTLINYKPLKRKILIKPNLVYAAEPTSGIITHPRIIEGLIIFLKKFNCEIIIAEGSAVGHDTLRVFEKTGYKDLAQKYQISLLDLNSVPRKTYKWKYGTINLPRILDECEYINVPTIKTHTITTVTLGTKNQKGLLDITTKKRFHTIGVNEAVRELANVIKPDLTIVNGLYCLEGNSISLLRKSKKLGLIVAGHDMFEVDSTCVKIMGLDPKPITHFQYIEAVVVLGEKINEVKKEFKPANEVRKIFHMEFQLNGCSGCSVAVERTMKKLLKKPFLLIKFLYLAIFRKITFVSGMSLKRPIGKDRTIVFIGNCTKGICEGKYSPGCPPEPEQIIEAIKRL